ncbi:alanine racemase [Leucobacter musarum]|uniref:alanine racemase n=1 Tax=Leucobacter musarum TaxID=1930747 RepID=UPI0006A77985|nr:alanine racemase [Leucobacter musarum]
MTTGEARVEIDPAAIRHNLGCLVDALSGDSSPEICAVVKADAYGHGIEHVLPLIVDAGIRSVGIASNAEARRVRELGFSGRIIRVRAAAPAEVAGALGERVEEWVGGFAHAQVIAEIALQHGVEIPVHLAINALGFSVSCVDLSLSAGRKELAAMVALRGLDVRGVCAHFPSEAVADAQRGAARFADEAEEVLGVLGQERAADVQRHCATSFAALTVAESRFDLVRIGAALYGDSSAPAVWQRSALRLVAPITSVNLVPAGRRIGYVGGSVLDGDAIIAAVPVGYGDGLPRALGNGRGSVLVRGHRAPIVDRLSMNALAVDVTAIPGVRPGDDAVVFGRQGAGEISGVEFERNSGEIAAASYSQWGRGIARTVRSGAVGG